MDLGLAGRTAIVNGASRGIGLATVEALAAEGVALFGAARTITKDLASAARATLAIDLSHPEAAPRSSSTPVQTLGGIYLLANNVGGVDAGELPGFAGLDDDQRKASNSGLRCSVGKRRLPELRHIWPQ